MSPRPIWTALAWALAACGPATTATKVTPPAPTTPTGEAAPATASYHARIRWTSYGVPHVVADDLGGLGFGQGHAMARGHLCEIADVILRVRGERARYLGAGPDDAHVDSDVAMLHLGYHRRATEAWAKLSADSRAMLDGFAAGYDHYLAHTPAAARPAACRDAAWLRPITGVDVAAYGLAVANLASSHFLERAIARAEPGAGHAALAVPRGGASNGWAIGGDRTASGGGLLVANPHFPWEGELQFFESQLTIPGQLDVYGVSLLGVPGIQIGVTDHHAWTHTFSSSTHMVVYRLDLTADGKHYRHGDQVRPIVPTTYQLAVRGGDGAVEQRAVTRYRTDVGPMLVTGVTPWDDVHAFTVRDVTGGELVALDQYLAMAKAKDRDGFERALALHATPFVNTIYADAAGDVLYLDGSRVPALSPEGLAGWKLMRTLVPAVEQAWQRGLVVLDGSNPTFDLVTDDPRAPGAIPRAQAPRVLRRDFVINANDSFRFTNPAAPETQRALSPLWGDDAGRPSARTLMNLTMVRADDAASGDDHQFTLDEAAAAMLSNRSFTAERLADDVAAACARLSGKGKGKRTPPAGCAELAAWDGRFTADRAGAALWRELTVRLATDDRQAWARPYDPAAPRLTPDGLTVDDAGFATTLEAAVTALGGAGGLARPLGDRQYALRGDARVAVSGGTELDGVANVVSYGDYNATLLPRTPPAVSLADGYPINNGTSFVLAAELTPTGARARALLTYGNSGDPASPYFRDQLALFAKGELRPVLRTDAEITADPAYTLEELVSP